jgi:hypothetical protein
MITIKFYFSVNAAAAFLFLCLTFFPTFAFNVEREKRKTFRTNRVLKMQESYESLIRLAREMR